MGFLLRAVGRRITKTLDEVAQTPEGQAALERGERERAVRRIVDQLAASGLDDEAARTQLRERLPDDPEAVQLAIKHLGEARTSYLLDRAYRLLTAAAANTPVRPIDPAVREQFEAEARLGRMSLSDAYAYLLSLHPRLSELPPRERPDPSAKGWSFSRGGRSPFEFVGPAVESQHAILNTDLAVSIVNEYTRTTRMGGMPDADPTPFFERRTHSVSGTFSLFGKGPNRPRATN